MKMELTSSIGAFIKMFLEFKRSQGLKYHTGEYYLSKLNDYWSLNGFDSQFSKEHIYGWIKRKEHENPTTHSYRIIFLREFSRFLQAQGLPNTYVIPRGMSKKGSKYMPYLLSEDKIEKFFLACDKIKPSKENPCKPLVLPAYFRFLYCCGVRTGEARLLKMKDVNLSQGFIDIMKTKGGHCRRLFLSHELVKWLEKITSRFSQCYPIRNYYFPRNATEAYSIQEIACSFNKIWRDAGLPLGCQPKPRAYCFRHHFAFANINRWVEKGYDVNGMLPYLMNYMGHSSIQSTFYYIHLIPDFFGVYSEKAKVLESMIPEVV